MDRLGNWYLALTMASVHTPMDPLPWLLIENFGPTSIIPGTENPPRRIVNKDKRLVSKEPCAIEDILNEASIPPSSAEVKTALLIPGGMIEPCMILVGVALPNWYYSQRQ